MGRLPSAGRRHQQLAFRMQLIEHVPHHLLLAQLAGLVGLPPLLRLGRGGLPLAHLLPHHFQIPLHHVHVLAQQPLALRRPGPLRRFELALGLQDLLLQQLLAGIGGRGGGPGQGGGNGEPAGEREPAQIQTLGSSA